MPAAEKCILLVDDETALLNLMELFLKKLGYPVEKRDRASEALALFQEDPARFSVVVADVTMPEIDGKKLALQMAALNPDLRVLLCSGYPIELESLPQNVRPRFAVLMKPFLPKMLSEAVQELMNRQVSQAS